MRLPNAEQAIVPKAKVVNYLLSRTHEQGRHKAAFFERYGFKAESWHLLASELIRHACEQHVTKIEDTLYGMRYTVEGTLFAPGGERIKLRSVWFIDKGDQIPRFVTAYPLERKE